MAKDKDASMQKKVLQLTKWLSDEQIWNWSRAGSDRDAADAVLKKMGELGLIEHKKHPLGGNIWIVGDKKFGRVDY